MTKEEAIQQIKEIRNGNGIDRNEYPESMRGDIAKQVWNNNNFSFGMEYGYILGLMKTHSITKEELK